MIRNLRKLNVEGNELIGLPPSLLSLPLTHVLIGGNFMHPALWRESCRAPPQVSILCKCMGYLTVGNVWESCSVNVWESCSVNVWKCMEILQCVTNA